MATVFPNPDFDADAAAEQLRDAMQGLGTNETMIIKTLVTHSNEQRQEIKEVFKQKYGKDMEDDLKDELGGDFENCVISFMAPPRTYDAREINRAIKGAGTEEGTLIEIMCSRTNEEIEQIKQEYAKEYDDASLEEDLQGDTSGYLRRMFVSLCSASRQEDEELDGDQIQADAQQIYDAGEAQWGTDEAEINSILCRRSFASLRSIFDAYEGIAGRPIEEAISTECSGDVEYAYSTIVKMARDMTVYFADRINWTMSGAGTDDRQLIRAIVSRCEIDLEDIKNTYVAKYEKTIAETIADDCGGDYKRMLLAICGEYSE